MGRIIDGRPSIRHTHIVSARNTSGVKDIFNFTPKSDLKDEIKARLQQYGDDWTFNVRELEGADEVRATGILCGVPGVYYYELDDRG